VDNIKRGRGLKQIGGQQLPIVADDTDKASGDGIV
jgi:hypothetical protein